MENRILKATDFALEERVEKLKLVLEKRNFQSTFVFENIHDPHNVSACMRSCDATGIAKVHLIYYGGQKFPKLGERSSASARKWVETVKHESIEDCYNKLRAEGKKIYTTHMSKDAVSIYDLDLTQPVALVLGNEHEGVSEEAVELADGNYLIPQIGMIQSLNISVAAAVSAYEIFRQRLNAGLFNTMQFNETEFDNELLRWARK